MEKQRSIKILSVVALIIAVLGLTVAFAAYQTTLNITGEGSVAGNTDGAIWKIAFNADTVSYAKTGNASVETEPEVTDTAISNFKVNLIAPGDSVTYTFDVENYNSTAVAEPLNAKISDSFKLPVLDLQGDTTDVENVKDYIKYSLKYSDGKDVAPGDSLEAGEAKTMELKIEYVKDESSQTPPTNPVTIGNLDFSIIYVQE